MVFYSKIKGLFTLLGVEMLFGLNNKAIGLRISKSSFQCYLLKKFKIKYYKSLALQFWLTWAATKSSGLSF
jgi:hypothetical protein